MPKTKANEPIITTQVDKNEITSDPTVQTAEAISAASPPAAEKPKRASRKKKVEAETAASSETAAENQAAPVTSVPLSPVVDRPVRIAQDKKTDSILTIEAYATVQTKENIDDITWHEIRDAYITRKILTGTLGGLEKMENGKAIAVVHYKGFRIAIPLSEMVFLKHASQAQYAEQLEREAKIINKMLGAEIDFMVRGIDTASRSIVASRKDAMLKKRQTFYMEKDANGVHRIYYGRIVQARIISVAEKAIRVEIFGVETTIPARDLAWYWISDARDYFAIGDTILLRILSVDRDSIEDIRVTADARSLQTDTSRDVLSRCRIQSKYAGKVTDIHRGVVYIRLANGVNAVAHSCMDHRTPGKKDDVTFVVTKLDKEQGIAVGIITRIIRQNL